MFGKFRAETPPPAVQLRLRLVCDTFLTLSRLLPLQIKCDQYWPSRGTETYGMTQVTLLDTIELATFCVRTFSLHKVRNEGLLQTLALGRLKLASRLSALCDFRHFFYVLHVFSVL